MVLCRAPDHCTVQSPDNKPLFKRNGIYQPGDIGMIFASVKQPMQYQVDGAKLSRAASRVTAQRFRDACTEMESRADGGKLRPCLILDEGPDGTNPEIPVDQRRPPKVSLMATFGMSDISKFPRGVRHHLVPIHTTSAQLGRREHLHTTPDWDGRSPQYIIAYEWYPSVHKVISHFKSPKSVTMPNGTNYSIGDQALTKFTKLCTSRTLMWQRMPEIEKKKDAMALLVRCHVLKLQFWLTSGCP
jgi:hypothetical protein